MNSSKNRSSLALIASLLVALAGCGIEPEELTIDANAGRDSAQPQDGGQIEIDAADGKRWSYFSFGGGVVVVDDASTSTEWDLALRRAQLATNSGTSGPGDGGAVATSAADFEALATAPADGYVVDALLPIPGPPGSGEYSGSPALAEWFDYDPATHAVSSKGIVYAIKSADGNYAKITIKGYSAGKYIVRWAYKQDGSRDF